MRSTDSDVADEECWLWRRRSIIQRNTYPVRFLVLHQRRKLKQTNTNTPQRGRPCVLSASTFVSIFLNQKDFMLHRNAIYTPAVVCWLHDLRLCSGSPFLVTRMRGLPHVANQRRWTHSGLFLFWYSRAGPLDIFVTSAGSSCKRNRFAKDSEDIRNISKASQWSCLTFTRSQIISRLLEA